MTGNARLLMIEMREDGRTPKFEKLLLRLGDIVQYNYKYFVRDFFEKDETTKTALQAACEQDGGLLMIVKLDTCMRSLSE